MVNFAKMCLFWVGILVYFLEGTIYIVNLSHFVAGPINKQILTLLGRLLVIGCIAFWGKLLFEWHILVVFGRHKTMDSMATWIGNY